MSSEPSPSFVETMPRLRLATSEAPLAGRADLPAPDFDEAMSLMEAGEWEEAYTRLAQLADGGHPQAARLALLFVRRGTALFGGAFLATVEQREAWQRDSDWD